MAFTPLQIPGYQQPQPVDWSPLANLGQVYQKARQASREQSLQDAFKNGLPRTAEGRIDYNSLNDTLSQHGADVGSLLSVAKMAEAQRKADLETTASSDFRTNTLGNIFGSRPSTSAAEQPTMQLGMPTQPAAMATTPTPTLASQRAPVQPSAKVWGDQEAIDAGLYDKPARGTTSLADIGKPVQVAAVQPVPSAAPKFNGLTADHVPALIQAMSDPRLPTTDRELAGKLLTRALDDSKEPDKIRTLNALKEQSGYTGTILQLEMDLKRAGKTDVSTNIDQRGESEEAKAAGKSAGERRAAMFAASQNATNGLSSLTRVSTLLDQVDQGKLEPGRMTISAWAKSLGVNDDFAKGLGLNPSKVGTAQAVQSLVNELVIGKLGPGGFPSNNFSDADRSFLTDLFPRLGNDPRANKIMIESARRVHNDNIQRALDYQTWKEDPANKVRSFEDFELNRARKVQQMDRFGDLRKQAEALLQSTAPSSSGGQIGGIQWRLK